MDKKYIGIIFIIIGILFISFIHYGNIQEEKYIMEFSESTGTCYLSDGTCLHDAKTSVFEIILYVVSICMILLGGYLIFFRNKENLIIKKQEEISKNIAESKRYEKEKDEFNAFVSTFDEKEKIILKIIKEEEGITQSTIRFKTGFSKATVSLIITALEKKGIISRKKKGKSFSLFIIKKY